MKKQLLSCLALGAIVFGTAGVAQALSYGFTVVEDNSILDPTSQFTLDVTDAGSGTTSFLFKNTGSIYSTITAIYFDWTAPGLTFSSFSSTGNVDFSVDANPANMPGGQNISFVADWSTDANSPAGTGKNGIDNWIGSGIQDSLTISFSSPTYNAITSALDDGSLRIGLHVQGISLTLDDDDESETYVNNTPIPEPATMLLFGTGLAGIAGVARRKISKG